MPRKSSNQWEFGELFSPQDTRRVVTVAQLTGNIRKLLENQIGTLWVSGEVTNLRVQASGHAYFSLKDPEAQLSCVLFRGVSFAGRSLLDNGAKVVAHGDLTVYEPRGQYQLVVRELEFQGAGALQLAFEKLKRELDAKGYFANERKRTLPRFLTRIGIATSASGAALRDVIHVVQRRHPGLQILLAPCRVQGDGAASEIADAIELLNQWSAHQKPGDGLDAILVTRGGGSLEDLWAFNELAVAEAIFRSAVPVVSAVGHEIDFTISDFVADARAATPSAAAEILTEGVYSARLTASDLFREMSTIVRRSINDAVDELDVTDQRLRRCEPTRMLHDRMQQVDELSIRIGRIALAGLRTAEVDRVNLHQRLLRVRPSEQLAERNGQISNLVESLQQLAGFQFKEMLHRTNRVCDRLRLLSPEQTLARGYSITVDAAGRLLRSIDALKIGDQIETRLARGAVVSEVIAKNESPDLPD